MQWLTVKSPWLVYYGKSKLLFDATRLYATSVYVANDHLDARIRDLDTRSVMGVPGDMNLDLLDYIKDIDGLTWGKYFLQQTQAHTDSRH